MQKNLKAKRTHVICVNRPLMSSNQTNLALPSSQPNCSHLVFQIYNVLVPSKNIMINPFKNRAYKQTFDYFQASKVLIIQNPKALLHYVDKGIQKERS